MSESAPFSFLRGRPMCEGILWSVFPWFSVQLSHSSLWIKELCYQLVYFGCWAGRARIQNVSFQTNWIATDRILWWVRWSRNRAVLGSYDAKSLEASPPALKAVLGKESRPRLLSLARKWTSVGKDWTEVSVRLVQVGTSVWEYRLWQAFDILHPIGLGQGA